MSGRLKNKVAVVTGGSSGIGLAMIKKFIAEGATAISADIAPPEDKQLEFVKTDVTSPDSLEKAVSKIVGKFKKIDILVANAGVSEKKYPVSQLDLNNWNKVLNIDLTGVALTNKYVVAQMQKQHHGSVVNMSSILGAVGGSESQAYSAAKAGVAMFTKSQAITYAKKGIRFNAVAPGYVNTSLLKGLPKKTTDFMLEMMPIGRLAEPEEIANVVSFVASDEASIITGALINADGGYTAG